MKVVHSLGLSLMKHLLGQKNLLMPIISFKKRTLKINLVKVRIKKVMVWKTSLLDSFNLGRKLGMLGHSYQLATILSTISLISGKSIIEILTQEFIL